MVSNVARLTRSLREAVTEDEPATPASSARAAASSAAYLAEKLRVVRRELSQKGQSIFVDERGNRFRIEQKPVQQPAQMPARKPA